MSKLLTFAIANLLVCQAVYGFVVHNAAPRSTMQLNVEKESNMSRRVAMNQIGSSLALVGVSTFGAASPATAKDKDKEPVSKETVTKSFQAVRDELEGSDGGIKTLESLIAKEDFEGVMEFTKGYDLEFRKAKMGKARKFITSKEEKEKAVALCNAVTFDLIGMNKGSRPGQRDIEQVKKYFGEIQADINSFLELEKGIDMSIYD